MDLGTPAARRARSAARQRSSLPPLHDVRRRSARRNGSGDVVADLVAAGADAGPDRGCERRRRRVRRPRLDDPASRPRQPGVEDGDRRRGAVRARERDRQAVGGEQRAAAARRSSVQSPSPGSPRGRRTPERRGRVDLAAERERAGSAPDLGAEPAPVLVDTSGVVVGRRPRLSESNGASLTPPSPRGEGDLVRARARPSGSAGSRARSARARPPARTRGRRARRSASGGAARRGPPPPAATRRGRARARSSPPISSRTSRSSSK